MRRVQTSPLRIHLLKNVRADDLLAYKEPRLGGCDDDDDDQKKMALL